MLRPGETRDAKTEYISRMPETKPPEPPSGPQPGRWVLSHGEIRTIVFGLMLAMFLAALNQTIVATALPTIGRDFRDFELLPWVVTAYLLTSTVVAPLYGKLSDIHGRRAMMLAASASSSPAPSPAPLATDMIMLILGRGLQGIGGGGILPLAQSILADVVAPRERGRYQAYMGSVWVTAGLGGPVLGGILAEHFHWSIIFWVNVPLGLVAARDGAAKPQAPAAPRAQAQARPARRRPDDGRGNSAPAGAHLGRNALSLAVCAHRRADPGLGGAVGPVRVAADCGRPSRSCRCPSSPIR